MEEKRGNNLTIIENGRIYTCFMDDKPIWKVGRVSVKDEPDIKLSSPTVSRNHGEFRNVNGIWFYIDYYGKNGTIYNGKRMTKGFGGCKQPEILSENDVLIFGGGESGTVGSNTAWAAFSEYYFEDGWRVIRTEDYMESVFYEDEDSVRIVNPEKGCLIKGKGGKAICMGDRTYLTGNIKLARGEM